MKINLPLHHIRIGYYSDAYFNRAKSILQKDRYHPLITHQIFQKKSQVTLCGVNEIKELLKHCTGYYSDQKKAQTLFHQYQKSLSQHQSTLNLDQKLNQLWINRYRHLKIRSLNDGDTVSANETVMHIQGDYSAFAHLENIFLGVLARRTQLATNTKNLVKAANHKPILCFANRSDYFLNQEGDGYAINIGGAQAVSTDAMGSLINQKGVGTIPHALIVSYQGDIKKTALKFSQYFPRLNTISLIDFNNNCVQGALESAQKLGSKLWGVRLDTASNMADVSTPKHKSVNPQLVKKVRQALDKHGYQHVKIIVSGGFNPDKIRQFENHKTPVDFYAVGSWILSHGKGEFDFTADAVQLNYQNLAKAGRKFSPNPRLQPW